jgi:hypothetical protein
VVQKNKKTRGKKGNKRMMSRKDKKGAELSKKGVLRYDHDRTKLVIHSSIHKSISLASSQVSPAFRGEAPSSTREEREREREKRG